MVEAGQSGALNSSRVEEGIYQDPDKCGQDNEYRTGHAHEEHDLKDVHNK